MEILESGWEITAMRQRHWCLIILTVQYERSILITKMRGASYIQSNTLVLARSHTADLSTIVLNFLCT